MRLARALPGAEVVEVDGNHDVFLAAPGAFAHALTAACLAAVTAQTAAGRLRTGELTAGRTGDAARRPATR